MEFLCNGLILWDLVFNFNLFLKVYCDEEGNMNFVFFYCKKGDFIMFRIEMNLFFLLFNIFNFLDLSGMYFFVLIEIIVDEVVFVSLDDYCLNFRFENKWVFENIWFYDLLFGNKILLRI